MLIAPGPIRVLVATKPVFAALVQEQLKADPFSGVSFCFRAGAPAASRNRYRPNASGPATPSPICFPID